MTEPSQPTSRKNFTYSDGVSLREYFEMRLAAIEQATHLAHCNLDTRLESMNEFRAAMRDQASSYLPRVEYDIQHRKLEEAIAELKSYRDTMQGKASQGSVNLALLISAIGIIISVIGLLTR